MPGLGKQIIDGVVAKLENSKRLDEIRITGAESRMNKAQYFGLVVALSSIGGAVYMATAVPKISASLAAIAIVLVCAGIGGPSVARVIADRIYLSKSRPPPPTQDKQRP